LILLWIFMVIHPKLLLDAAIPAQSLAVSSLDDDSIIGEQFARPLGPDAGQIVSKTDTTSP
jgi:hypothetical protein